MNYTEYNNQLKLPDDLYKKTLAGVKSEISKHNQIQRKKKVAYLSFAACFMILVTSISSKASSVLRLASFSMVLFK